MMKNLKLLITLTLLTCSASVFSQRIGIKAGLNLSDIDYKSTDEFDYDMHTSMKAGFHVGPTIDFPISKMFSIESGVIFATKGYRMKETSFGPFDSYEYVIKVDLLYADLPILAKVSVDVGKVKLYGSLGPYIGLGLVGAIREKYSEAGLTETDGDIINFGADQDGLSRLDYGASGGLGAELNSFSLGVTYNYGMANIITGSIDESSAKNRVLAISLGYKFGSGKKEKE